MLIVSLSINAYTHNRYIASVGNGILLINRCTAHVQNEISYALCSMLNAHSQYSVFTVYTLLLDTADGKWVGQKRESNCALWLVDVTIVQSV